VEEIPRNVLSFRKTKASDNWATFWQLRNRRVRIMAVQYLRHGVFTTYRGSLDDIDVDASLLCVDVGTKTWVEQHGVYRKVDHLTVWPDVTADLPWIHQWEILRLIYA